MELPTTLFQDLGLGRYKQIKEAISRRFSFLNYTRRNSAFFPISPFHLVIGRPSNSNDNWIGRSSSCRKKTSYLISEDFFFYSLTIFFTLKAENYYLLDWNKRYTVENEREREERGVECDENWSLKEDFQLIYCKVTVFVFVALHQQGISQFDRFDKILEKWSEQKYVR